jgi:outer membrane protein OmpA-like peptidoglycan-associated protein
MKRLALIAAIALAIPGCSKTGIAILPNDGGPAGGLALIDTGTGADIAVIDQPNSKNGINGRRVITKVVAAQAMTQQYGDLLAALPEAPKLFVLYFREGSTQLIDESNALIPELFQELKRRPGVDVQIVGHTDTVGAAEANDALSVRRAEQVRAMLVGMGMDQAIVRATGRGEREPLEPTGDDVASVFNRRVEVLVK